MLIPGTLNQTVWRTGTWEEKFELFKDLAHTEKYDITEWEVGLVINGLLTLTEGAGITILGARTLGVFEAVLIPKQTEEAEEGRTYKYWIKLTKKTGNKEVWFPLAGELTFVVP